MLYFKTNNGSTLHNSSLERMEKAEKAGEGKIINTEKAKVEIKEEKVIVKEKKTDFKKAFKNKKK